MLPSHEVRGVSQQLGLRQRLKGWRIVREREGGREKILHGAVELEHFIHCHTHYEDNAQDGKK